MINYPPRYHIDNKFIKNYETIRINLVIPDSNKDLEVGKSFLLENNFEIMNAIDFNKGCYIGQENTPDKNIEVLQKNY